MQLIITKKELECQGDLIKNLDKLFGNDSGFDKGLEKLKNDDHTKFSGGYAHLTEDGNLILNIQEEFFCDVLELYKDLVEDGFDIALIVKSMLKRFEKGITQLAEKYKLPE